MNIVRLFCTLTGSAAALACSLSLAQVPRVAPGAGQILKEVTPPPKVPPKPAEELTIPGAPAQPGAAPADSKISFKLSSVRFKGNTVYSEEQLRPLVVSYVGKTVGMNELHAMTTAIADYYHRGGYFLARALFEPQDVSRGELQITILEGRVSRVRVEKAPDAPVPQLLIDGLLSRIKPGRPLNQHELERAMLLLSDVPGITVSSSLEPGVESGSTDLVVEVNKGRRLRGNIDADNYGTYYTGYYRLGGSVRWTSPFRRGDAIDLRLLGSDHLGVVFGRLGYETPLGSRGLRLNVGVGRLNYELQKDLKDSLGGKGYADTIDVGLTYPLIRSRGENLFLQAGVVGKRLQDRYEKVDLTSNKRVLLATLGVNYERRDRLLGGGYTNLSGTLFAGRLDLRSEADEQADQAPGGPRTAGNFGKLNFSASRLQAIWGRFTGFLAVSGQAASKNLDSAERIALGGPYAVRAYSASEGIVSQGVVGSAELRYSLTDDITLSTFYDASYGTHYVDAPDGSSDDVVSLRGYGLGLMWVRPGSFSVRTSVAWRETKAGVSEPQDHNPRVFAQLVKTF